MFALVCTWYRPRSRCNSAVMTDNDVAIFKIHKNVVNITVGEDSLHV